MAAADDYEDFLLAWWRESFGVRFEFLVRKRPVMLVIDALFAASRRAGSGGYFVCLDPDIQDTIAMCSC